MMSHKKYVVELSSDERAHLNAVISKGKTSAKALLKARILLKADQGPLGQGWTDDRIVQALDSNPSMVVRARRQLVEEGLEAVLTRKRRATPPIPPIFDGRGPGAADRAGLLRAAGGARPLEHPPAGRQGGGAGDRRAGAFQHGGPGA